MLSLEQSQWVRSVSFSSDNKFLAIGCGSSDESRQGFLNFKERPGEVIVYRLPKFEEIQRFTLDGRAVNVGFSPDSSLLAAAMGEMDNQLSYIRLWKTDSFKEFLSIRNLKTRNPSPVFTPDSQTLVIGEGRPNPTQPAVIKSFDLLTGGLSSVFHVDMEEVKLNTISPDGKFLVVAAQGGKTFFLNYPRGTAFDFPGFGKTTSGQFAGKLFPLPFPKTANFLFRQRMLVVPVPIPIPG